jgi:GDP-4-dehydro-6-deoxy-D-mannose reductase
MGNFDVRRDFTDVRDVVRAYRLLLEAMAAGSLGGGSLGGGSLGGGSLGGGSVRGGSVRPAPVGDPSLAADPPIVNVGSGRSITIRELLEILCRIADVPMTIRQDPALVRPNEAPEIRADISLVQSLVDWTPRIPLEVSLADLLASLED